MNKISITNAESYNQTVVTGAIRRHFEMLGINKEITSDMTVLIKPNLLMKRRPEEATTTHPSVVAGVIECLHELHVKDIIIAESPGGPYNKQALSGIYGASGMAEVAKKYGVRINYDFTSFERPVKNGVKVHSFMLIKPVKEADYIINVAKLKTHTMTTLSGAVKNLFGTVPGLMKPELHFRFPDKSDFANMLIDLCETIKPNLCIIDAVVSMEGDGPSGGTPRETGLILASKNPYNLDVALCKLIGLQTSEVPTVDNAIKRGLSVDNFNKLGLLGDKIMPIKDYAMPASKSLDFTGHMPKFASVILKPFSERFLQSKPIIRTKSCIGCGKCAEICPAKTIKIVSHKAVIHYDKCIKCFCCHEMCPPKAIDIKQFGLFKRSVKL